MGIFNKEYVQGNPDKSVTLYRGTYTHEQISEAINLLVALENELKEKDGIEVAQTTYGLRFALAKQAFVEDESANNK